MGWWGVGEGVGGCSYDLRHRTDMKLRNTVLGTRPIRIHRRHLTLILFANVPHLSLVTYCIGVFIPLILVLVVGSTAAQTKTTEGPRRLAIATAYNHYETPAFRLASMRDLRPARVNARGGARYWEGGLGFEAYAFGGGSRDRYNFALTYQVGHYYRAANGFTFGAAALVGGGLARAYEYRRAELPRLGLEPVSGPLLLLGLRPQLG